MKLIERPIYLSKIRPFYKKNLIKVITGIRRSGKTYLLYLIEKDIKKRFSTANIIFVDKEKVDFDFIKNYKDLFNFVKQNLKPQNNFLLINEVQQIESFEKALIDLTNNPELDIYCTGSNAYLLSSELSTLLSGRQIVIPLYPLSYNEFLKFHKLKSSQQALQMYLKYGGLPYLMHLPKNDEIIFSYLENVVDTIIYRDILNRFNIRESFILTDILKFLATTTGNLVSSKRIQNFLKNQGINKSLSSVINIIEHLTNAFIITEAKRFNINGAKVFEKNSKFYFTDLGLRNALIGYKINDIAKIIENIVFNHLKILGYKIFVGQLYNAEIDFVAEKNNERIYIQVAYILNDDKTIEREFGNLLKIKDNYPKYVISTDYFEPLNTYKGIKHITLENFLKKGL